MEWLAVSIVLSVVLTVVLNIALRVVPGASARLGRSLEDLTTREPPDAPASGRRVHVVFPWKAMLLASLVLTLLLNALHWFG